MPWLFLLLAIAAFAVAFKTTSMALAVVCLLAALGLLLAWVMGLLAQRVGSQSRDDSQMLDPRELQRLREQAEARRAGNAAAPGEPPTP
jgi:ABC-type transport system involved in cytochrome bd biosynthesis fused ATPase/permease subunit